MAKQYVPMCGMKGCKNKKDAQGRFGNFCYWHRNFDYTYVKNGGDKKYQSLSQGGIGLGRPYKYKGKTLYDPSSEIPPVAYFSSVLSNGLGISSQLSNRLSWACSKMDNQKDTVPQFALEHANERFDQMGKLLVSTKIGKENIGVMHMKGFTTQPYSDTLSVRGVPTKYPAMEHDVIVVYDNESIKGGSGKVYVVDPSIAALAPVDNKSDPIDVQKFPPEKTPFSDGVHISPVENYLQSSTFSWDKFGVKWMNEL